MENRSGADALALPTEAPLGFQAQAQATPELLLTPEELEGPLPSLCICCGAPSTVCVAKKLRDFKSLFPNVRPGRPSLGWLIAMLATLNAPYVRLRTPLCQEHRNYWTVRWAWLWGGIAGLALVTVSSIVFAVVVGLRTNSRWPDALALGLVLIYMIAWIAGWVTACRKPKLILAHQYDGGWMLQNASAPFMAALSAATAQRRFRDGETEAGPMARWPSGGPRQPPQAASEPVGASALPEVLPASPVGAVLPPAPVPVRPERPAPSKAPVWLLLGGLGGLGLLSCLGVLLAFWLAGKPSEADYKLYPNGVRQPPPPSGEPGKTTVDLVPLIDPARDKIHGDWNTQYNILQCTSGGFVPRVQIPYQPPAEYDFVVVFSQPNLRNGISLIMPNPNGGAFFWAIGALGGDFGFGGNPGKRGPGVFPIKPDTHYTTIVQVRRDGVRALVNGTVLLDHKTNFRDLGVDDWRAMPDTKLLGVACDDPTVFHYVRVVEISGKGAKVR